MGVVAPHPSVSGNEGKPEVEADLSEASDDDDDDDGQNDSDDDDDDDDDEEENGAKGGVRGAEKGSDGAQVVHVAPPTQPPTTPALFTHCQYTYIGVGRWQVYVQMWFVEERLKREVRRLYMICQHFKRCGFYIFKILLNSKNMAKIFCFYCCECSWLSSVFDVLRTFSR